MYDFHTHILPCIDDGSKSISESLEMLHMSKSEGITHIVATPHFYADRMTPKDFFTNRKLAWENLQSVLDDTMPTIKMGSEVHYFEGMSHYDDIHSFCIENTNLLLVEMPFNKWNERMVMTLLDLYRNRDIQVILAHYERYLQFKVKSNLDFLQQNGIYFQSNAEFFINSKTSKLAIKELKSGHIQFLGSDCHNTITRKPNLGYAINIIQNKLGGDELNNIKNYGKEYFK